jgi:hypothetical protein
MEKETLEEAFEQWSDKQTGYDKLDVLRFGAKWQQERMYSEQDMIDFVDFVATYPNKNRNVYNEILHAKSKYDGAERTIDLLKQFKKK